MNGFDWSQERAWLAWLCIDMLASPAEILCCPHDLLERAVCTLREGTSEDRNGASELLFAYGKTSVENREWTGALWLKRLSETALHREGIASVGRVAGFLQPHLDAAVTEALRVRSWPLDRFREDAFGVLRELIIDGRDDPAKSIPGLLMATQIRLASLLKSGDPLLAPQFALLEASMYADAGYTRDAKDSGLFAAEMLQTVEPTHELRPAAAQSLIMTADTCRKREDVESARLLGEVGISLLDESHPEYVTNAVALACQLMLAGDLRQAYRFAESANRQSVGVKSSEAEAGRFIFSVVKATLTGDGRHLSADVNLSANEFGASGNSMSVFSSHIRKMQAGKKLSDEDLIEGATEFIECARRSRDEKGRNVAAAEFFAAALRNLLSLQDRGDCSSMVSEIVGEANLLKVELQSDLAAELESLERLARSRFDSLEVAPPMAPKSVPRGIEELQRMFRVDNE